MERSNGWIFNTEFGGWLNTAIVKFGQKMDMSGLGVGEKSKKIINKWVVSEKEHG